MKKILLLLTAMFSLVLLTNCEENEETPAILEINYVGFESKPLIGVDPTSNATEEIKVATSNTTSTDRTFNIVVNTALTSADASAYTVPLSVTVPANSNIGTFNLDLVGPNINSSGSDILALDFVSQEGLSIGETMQINLKQVCPLNEVIVSFSFDTFPEEAYWQLFDNSNDEFIDGDGYAGNDCYVDLSATTKTFCLPSGEYRFVMGDCFGDGGTAFELSSGGTILASSAGVSGAGEIFIFSLP